MLLSVVRAVGCTFMGPILLAALIAPLAGAADALVGRVRVGGGPQKDVIVWLLGVPEAAPTPRRVVLDQRNMTFLPHVLGVTVGTRVEMPNNDRVFHNVFSFKDGKRFDLGLYPVGTTKVVEFDKPGLSRIFCNIHPTMAAYVLAVESPFVAVTDAGGRFEIPGVPPGRYEYRAWRPGAETIAGSLTVAPGAISALVLFMNAEDEQIGVRRAVPMTLAKINSAAAVASLVDGLSSSDPLIRKYVIEALAYLRTRHPKIHIRPDIVAEQIRRDAIVYLRSLADLFAVSSGHESRFDGPYALWQSSGRVPTLLQQALAQRMASTVENIFRLLKLIHPARDVEATYRSLGSGQQGLRATALEYLDNSLTGGVRRDVFAVIDDAPVEDKLRKAAQIFNITIDTPEQTLGRLLAPDASGDPAGVLAFAAIHTVYTERIAEFYRRVVELGVRTPNQLLRETSEWVVAKLGLQKGPGVSPTAELAAPEGPADMKKMALIEKVVLLQGVDLFAACNAEQVLQLASIASEIWFEAGGIVYHQFAANGR